MGESIFCSEGSILTFQRTMHLRRFQNTNKEKQASEQMICLSKMKIPLNHGVILNQNHLDILSTWEMFLYVMSYAFSVLARDFFFYMVAHEPYVFFAHVVVGRSSGYMWFLI